MVNLSFSQTILSWFFFIFMIYSKNSQQRLNLSVSQIMHGWLFDVHEMLN